VSVRDALFEGISFVQSVEANRSAAALTLDHAISEQIALLEGLPENGAGDDGTAVRESYVASLNRLEQDVVQAVSAIRSAGSDPGKLRALLLSEDAEKEQE
jgi:hypothetical protein